MISFVMVSLIGAIAFFYFALGYSTGSLSRSEKYDQRYFYHQGAQFGIIFIVWNFVKIMSYQDYTFVEKQCVVLGGSAVITIIILTIARALRTRKKRRLAFLASSSDEHVAYLHHEKETLNPLDEAFV